MGERPARTSRFHRLKSRVDGLVERLRRTSFRDGLERELLLAELGRKIAELSPSGRAPSRAVSDEDGPLLEEAIEALAAVNAALSAFSGPRRTDAWGAQMARLEDHLSVLLAAEEDLLAAQAQGHAVAAASTAA